MSINKQESSPFKMTLSTSLGHVQNLDIQECLWIKKHRSLAVVILHLISKNKGNAM